MTQHIKYPEEVRMEATKAQLNRVVNKILENVVDLDPEFSMLIDEHFWELVENAS